MGIRCHQTLLRQRSPQTRYPQRHWQTSSLQQFDGFPLHLHGTTAANYIDTRQNTQQGQHRKPLFQQRWIWHCHHLRMANSSSSTYGHSPDNIQDHRWFTFRAHTHTHEVFPTSQKWPDSMTLWSIHDTRSSTTGLDLRRVSPITF